MINLTANSEIYFVCTNAHLFVVNGYTQAHNSVGNSKVCMVCIAQ